MDISGYRVLMTAGCIGLTKMAILPGLHSMAIKLHQRRKVMFQMIWSGSLSLVGGKNAGVVLKTIRSSSLGEITQSMALSSENTIKSLEDSIVRGMERLKQFDRDGMF